VARRRADDSRWLFVPKTTVDLYLEAAAKPDGDGSGPVSAPSMIALGVAQTRFHASQAELRMT